MTSGSYKCVRTLKVVVSRWFCGSIVVGSTLWATITVPAGAADRILAAFATHPLVEHAAAGLIAAASGSRR